MRRDPKQRKDGKCAADGCTEPLPESALRAGDPFHRSHCARVYHGAATTKDVRSADLPTRAKSGVNLGGRLTTTAAPRS